MSGGRKLGILVGGRPRTRHQRRHQRRHHRSHHPWHRGIGIYDGFRWLCRGDSDHVLRLQIPDVSRIHFDGGSILRTARDNPARSRKTLDAVADTLTRLELDYLVTIGGDDTAFSAGQVAQRLGGSLRVAHVPKTIDNDIPLPGNMPTFGFQTARHVGVDIVHNLMEDARTTGRWYLVVTMGRKAGHLALGIGKASGATLSIVAEEFPPGATSLDRVCDILEGAIIKRRVMGRTDGVALIAEGIGARLNPQELEDLPGVELEHDPHGHIELREIPLAHLLKQRLEARFASRGDEMTVVIMDLGYELRSAPPIPYDCEYVRDLGWGAVTYLMSQKYSGGAIVCLDEGRIRPLPFQEMIDPDTGRTRVRMVDVNSQSYQVALEYMIRLRPEDLEDPDQVARLAEAARMEPVEFRRHFGSFLTSPP